jgi:nitroimidazol reductase NimA-like FMN-containing flavoprotein (pyridoxamine 5'-phosphate oxidase superfamily)
MMVEPRSGQLEVLDDTECVGLLRSHDLGRIALVDRDVRPLIFPVNYFFDEGVIVFRTGRGSKLDLAPGAHVSFEIDAWDSGKGIGWSVLAKGIAHDVTNPRGAPSGRMRFWPVNPVAPGSREHWIGVWVNEITGRRFGPAAATEPE